MRVAWVGSEGHRNGGLTGHARYRQLVGNGGRWLSTAVFAHRQPPSRASQHLKYLMERCHPPLCSRHPRAVTDAARSEGGVPLPHSSPRCMRLPPVCRRDGPGGDGTAARLLAGAALLQERGGSGRAALREMPGFCDGSTTEETLHACLGERIPTTLTSGGDTPLHAEA